MYITAHRVMRDTSEHTNAFVHTHGIAFPWPDNAADLPETDPGQEIEALRHIELAPGGNRIRSFLDELAPDDAEWPAIDDALRTLSEEIEQHVNPAVFKCGPVTLRFGVDFGMTPERRPELERLRRYARERWLAWRGCPTGSAPGRA